MQFKKNALGFGALLASGAVSTACLDDLGCEARLSCLGQNTHADRDAQRDSGDDARASEDDARRPVSATPSSASSDASDSLPTTTNGDTAPTHTSDVPDADMPAPLTTNEESASAMMSGPDGGPDSESTSDASATLVTPTDAAISDSGTMVQVDTKGARCGDGEVAGGEVCDDRVLSTEIGACNPECSGYYTKKTIRRSTEFHGTDLGGIAGADDICASDFGTGWKALLVGDTRRASVTPFVGDGQLDWVLHKYTYYFNEQTQLIWRADTIPLLGAREAQAVPLLAPLFQSTDGRYPWSGYRPDWTTIENGTCGSWTSADSDVQSGYIVDESLTVFAANSCKSAPTFFVLCVEQ